jgi:hypothetical protein
VAPRAASRPHSRAMRLLLVTLLLALGVAAPAAADSLVYVKDGNVFSARPDGSQQRQITRDGSPQDPYGSPSQADDGTILAVRGSRFYKFGRDGSSLGPPLDSLLTRKPAAIGAVGPFDARISPDGSRFASWLGIMGGYYDYATNRYYYDPQSAVVYQSVADGTPLGQTMFYEEPSWLADSNRLLLWDSMNGGVPQVAAGAMGADHNHFAGWFHDYDTHDYELWNPLGAGELTRSGTRLAALRAGGTMGEGYMARGRFNGITIYDVGGLDRAPALWPCVIQDDNGGELTPPSWSPSGDALVWSAPDGIWTTPVRSRCEELAPKLVIPGGREPDWGPSDPAGAAAGPAQPGGGQAPARAATVKVAGSVKRGALLRRGLTVRVECPAACSVDAKAGRLARGRAKGAGTVQAKVRLTKQGRRAVKRGARRLTVKVTVRQEGQAAQTASRAVRIRR